MRPLRSFFSKPHGKPCVNDRRVLGGMVFVKCNEVRWMRRMFGGYPGRESSVSNMRRPLICLGSSSTEIFDYIYGRQSNYYPFWASGWRGRSLGTEPHINYLKNILHPLPRSANIFLNFGSADINFHFRHLAVKYGVYDFARYLDEVRQGILTAGAVLEEMGFTSIYAVFVSPPMCLSQDLWNKRGHGRQLPDHMRGKMYYDLCMQVADSMDVIEFFDEITYGEDRYYLLRRDYNRAMADHHPDYTKLHKLVEGKLRRVPGILAARKRPLRKLYPHKPAQIKEMVAEMVTRPNTCR